MSIFLPVKARCASCETTVEVRLAASVNADRRPDLRGAILDGSFQSTTCPACAKVIRLPAHLTYIDMDRGQWFLVEDPVMLAHWRDVEAEAAELHATSFGPTAPPPQRAIGEGIVPRLVFGWPALREKLLAGEAGLDDITLELFKISVLRNIPDPPLADATELRLAEIGDDMLTFRWSNTLDEEAIADLPIERALFDAFAVDLTAWADLRAGFDGVLFVDMRRLLLTPAPGPSVGEPA